LDEFFSRRCSVELRLLPRILLGRPRLVETERRACAHGGRAGGGRGADPWRRARRRGSLEAGIGGLGLRAHCRRRAHSGAAAELLVGLRAEPRFHDTTGAICSRATASCSGLGPRIVATGVPYCLWRSHSGDRQSVIDSSPLSASALPRSGNSASNLREAPYILPSNRRMRIMITTRPTPPEG
jgi:hypothetical protein